MKLTTHLHRGFTLIELMIVIAIIGILAPIAYPKAMGYIERAHDLELRMAYKQLLTVIDQFIMDKWGELASSTGQMNNIWEYYYIAYQDMSGPAILWSGWERYDTLSQYVQSSPEAQSAIKKIESLNPMDELIYPINHEIIFYKCTSSEWRAWWWDFVWLPEDNSTFVDFEWWVDAAIEPYAGSASSTDGDYFAAYSWGGVDYPEGYSKTIDFHGENTIANKVCYPWKGWMYITDTNWINWLYCEYFSK